MAIKNVVICGLGALGLTYASKLKDICNLKVLANTERIKKYRKNTPILNGKEELLYYILPSDKFEADLIIISTKALGLDLAIEYIKNFVNEKTIIISLINGISSEDRVAQTYPQAKILHSYFIGHSAIGVNINNKKQFFQDGVGKIVFEKNDDLEKFFKDNKIDYEISSNIIYSQWVKLGVNIVLNQLTAIYNLSVGELRNRSDFLDMAKNLLSEVKEIAKAHKINGIENYEKEVINATFLIADDGKTSMHQDVLARRKTEVDIFSGEIIRLGKIYNIKTPYNEDIYNKIKEIEKDF